MWSASLRPALFHLFPSLTLGGTVVAVRLGLAEGDFLRTLAFLAMLGSAILVLTQASVIGRMRVRAGR